MLTTSTIAAVRGNRRLQAFFCFTEVPIAAVCRLRSTVCSLRFPLTDNSFPCLSFSDIYLLIQVYEESTAIRDHILWQVWKQTKTLLAGSITHNRNTPIILAYKTLLLAGQRNKKRVKKSDPFCLK